MGKNYAGTFIYSTQSGLFVFLIVGLFVGGLRQLALVASVALLIVGASGFFYGLAHRKGGMPAYIYVCGADFILGLLVLLLKFIL